jgi:hypothetical protein
MGREGGGRGMRVSVDAELGSPHGPIGHAAVTAVTAVIFMSAVTAVIPVM